MKLLEVIDHNRNYRWWIERSDGDSDFFVMEQLRCQAVIGVFAPYDYGAAHAALMEHVERNT